MDTSISKLLGDDTLPLELVSSLQEAFDKKVTEARAEAEATIREEFAARYEHDKGALVEAMDHLVSDVMQKHEAEKADAIAKFEEARKQFRKATKESRRTYRSKLDENINRSRLFVTEQLSKEISKLREQKKALKDETEKTSKKVGAMKEYLARVHSKRLAKIDEFVAKQVTKELTEFNEDHRALVETRVKLVSEARKRLRETQTRFVKEAANKVEKVVNEFLIREMTQLHEDLEKNRQNMFGRRIFEAVAAEFMTSYLAEGTEIRKLQKALEAKETELSSTATKLNEAVKESQQASRKAKLAEDRATRNKMMSELLSNLRGDKRTVMEGMLETVKTEALRETFSKLLPVVLDETTRRMPAQNKRTLNETRQASRHLTTVTGDNRSASHLFDATQRAENEIDNDIAQVVRLAGIVK